MNDGHMVRLKYAINDVSPLPKIVVIQKCAGSVSSNFVVVHEPRDLRLDNLPPTKKVFNVEGVHMMTVDHIREFDERNQCRQLLNEHSGAKKERSPKRVAFDLWISFPETSFVETRSIELAIDENYYGTIAVAHIMYNHLTTLTISGSPLLHKFEPQPLTGNHPNSAPQSDTVNALLVFFHCFVVLVAGCVN